MGFSGGGREETAASACRSVLIAMLLLARGGAKAEVSGSVKSEIKDASFMVGAFLGSMYFELKKL